MKCSLSQNEVHDVGRFQGRKSPTVDVLNKVSDDSHSRLHGCAVPERQEALA